MVSSPGEKFRRFGAFKPFVRPISPIAPAVQDDPTMFIRLNEDWVSIANGALGSLARPETWASETEEGTQAMVQNGHEILSLWQPWSEHISVPDWEFYNMNVGFSIGVLSQRGENATGPFHVYAFLQDVANHFKFRDRTSQAWVGGLLTVAECLCVAGNFDQIVASVTPCNGLPVPFTGFGGLNLVDLMGGAFECREIEAWCDSQLYWKLVIKNNWVCGSV